MQLCYLPWPHLSQVNEALVILFHNVDRVRLSGGNIELGEMNEHIHQSSHIYLMHSYSNHDSNVTLEREQTVHHDSKVRCGLESVLTQSPSFQQWLHLCMTTLWSLMTAAFSLQENLTRSRVGDTHQEEQKKNQSHGMSSPGHLHLTCMQVFFLHQQEKLDFTF